MRALCWVLQEEMCPALVESYWTVTKCQKIEMMICICLKKKVEHPMLQRDGLLIECVIYFILWNDNK